MLFGGIMSIDDKDYTVYYLEDKNFSRLDICRPQSEFQVEPHNVLYSQYTDRQTFQLGNVSIRLKYNELVDYLESSTGEHHPETSWENGVFIQKITKVVGEGEVFELTKKNGKIYSKTYMRNGDYLSISVIAENMNTKLLPINSRDYERVELVESRNVVDNSTSAYVPLSVLKTRYDLSWEKKVDYRVVDNLEEARELIRNFDKKAIAGFDFETTGVDFDFSHSEEIVGIVLSDKDDVSYYLPFRHEKFDNLPLDFMEEVFQAMYDANLCAHNKKFERKVLMSVGHRYLPIKHDSFIASVLSDSRMLKGLHTLKNQAEIITGNTYLELEHIFEGRPVQFQILDKEITRVYACPDADNCKKVLRAKLDIPGFPHGIYDMECDLADLKAEQEYFGMRINYKQFLKDQENCLYIINDLTNRIRKVTRTEINFNSSAQMGELLYGRMRCPVYIRTKEGKPSTGAKCLKRLAKEKKKEKSTVFTQDIKDMNGRVLIKADDLNEAKYSPILIINVLREYTKLYSSFFQRFSKNAVNGRIHFWINQLGAESGRQSSPMHQLPKSIKKNVLADSEDHYMITADYSQIELRLTAYKSGQKDLQALCCDPAIDIHRAILSIIKNKPIWEISSQERKEGKAVNFGVVYLISASGLAGNTVGAGYTKEDVKRCQESLDTFFSTFKHITMMLRENRQYILANAMAHSHFGRTRHFPKLNLPDLTNSEIERIVRQGNNMPIQGTAADIMKLAEVRINDKIKEYGWDKLVDTPQGKLPLFRIMLSAHDEADISVHKSLPYNKVLKLIVEAMEMQIEDWGPLFSSVSIVDNWEEGKDDQYEIPIGLRTEIINGPDVYFEENPRDEMLKIINDYRDEELREYMEGLVAQAGAPDADLITPLVRHDVLTHDLISRFKQSKAHKAEHGALDHYQSIRYAVERYLEWAKGEELEESHSVEHIEAMTDEELKKSYEELTGESEEMFEFDDKGDIVNVSYDIDDYQSYSVLTDEEIKTIHDVTAIYERQPVWVLFDRVIFDLNGLFEEDVNKLLALFAEEHKEDDIAQIYIQYDGKLIETDYKSDSIDIKKYTEWIEERCL